MSSDLVFTLDRVGAALRADEIAFATDSDGDISVRWSDGDHVLITTGGARKQMLVSNYSHRGRYPLEKFAALCEASNTWNKNQYFPKAYVHRRKDDSVCVMGEIITDLDYGCSDEHLGLLVTVIVRTSVQLGKAVETWLAPPPG